MTNKSFSVTDGNDVAVYSIVTRLIVHHIEHRYQNDPNGAADHIARFYDEVKSDIQSFASSKPTGDDAIRQSAEKFAFAVFSALRMPKNG